MQLDPKRYDVAIKQIQKDLSEKETIIKSQTRVITETQDEFAHFKNLTAGEIQAVLAEFGIVKAELGAFETVVTEKLDAQEIKTKELEADYIEADEAVIKQITGNIADYKLIMADELLAIDGKFENLDAEYAKLNKANIDQAWVEDLMVTGKFLADDFNAATGSFSKYLTGVNIVGDNIKAGTISTDRLIIRDPDTNKGILYEINNGVVDQTNLSPEELKRLCVDGKILVAESVTADKINVTDLFAQDITSTGNFNMGGNGALVYDYEKDELSIRVKEFFVGNSGRTIDEELEEIRNDKQVINVGARNLIRNSKHLMFDSYGFGHDDLKPFRLERPTISIDAPKLGRPKISLQTARLDRPSIYLHEEVITQLSKPEIYLHEVSDPKLSKPEIYMVTVEGTSAVLGDAVLGQMVLGTE